jgi:aminoglycoside phosphotransferase (APT) family kinase protein
MSDLDKHSSPTARSMGASAASPAMPGPHDPYAPHDPHDGHQIGADSHDLAVTMDPSLHAACGGHLQSIEWFHSAWQRSGAATGFSKWRFDGGEMIDVVVKLPIGRVEYHWTSRLGEWGRPEPDAGRDHEAWQSAESQGQVTPRVLACGANLGEQPISWLIMERLPGSPMASSLTEQCLHDIIAAAVEFHQSAERCEHVRPDAAGPHGPDWQHLVERSKEVARAQLVPEHTRWIEQLKRTLKVLPMIVQRWSGRTINTWCHGDLHGGNAMRRGANNRCVLLDLALVHPGHWVEDALYLERQFWGHPEKLFGIKPVSELARVRRERGLPASDNYADLANLRRVLMAASAPAVMDREGGSPKYLHAALETLERVLPQVAH